MFGFNFFASMSKNGLLEIKKMLEILKTVLNFVHNIVALSDYILEQPCFFHLEYNMLNYILFNYVEN